MVIQVADDVWWVNLRGVNAYLVDDNGSLVLVDTGFPWQWLGISKAVRSLGWTLEDIDAVLLTHYDVDHVGGLTGLEGLDAPIYIGRADEPSLTGSDAPAWTTRKGFLQRAPALFHGTPDLPVKAVDDGDTIGSFTAYHAPGHTPGHTVYVSESLSVALLGDLVVGWNGRLRPAPWIICHDPAQAKRDVVTVAERVPSFTAACPGHGVAFAANGSRLLTEAASRVKSQTGQQVP